jgi:hypothetical protein
MVAGKTFADKGDFIMPCSQNCNQGRDCQCGDRSVDKATVIIAGLLIICILSIGIGLIKLFNGTKGLDCEIDVHFKDSTATYIGKTV